MAVDQWRLFYPPAAGFPGADLAWGPYSTGIMNEKPPDFGTVELRTDDQDRPRDDGRAFGRDFFGGRTGTFELLVLGRGEAQVQQRMDELTLAWRADAVRRTPGAVAELHVNAGGRRRVAYGRPRRFAPAPDKHSRQGVARVIADFACVDDCWYGPDVHTEWVPLVPPPSGGLVAPLVTPLTTTPATQRPAAISVAGDLPAWPIITFYGPGTNPSCQVTGLWTLGLDVSLAFDQRITVDTRPWRRTVLRQDGASFAGALTRSSPRLNRAFVPPGQWEIVLRGVDASGTADMQFAWQSRHSAR